MFSLCALCNKSCNAHTTDSISYNAKVAGGIRYVDCNNGNVSSNNANVAGGIRHVGCYIANAGDRIDVLSQFIASVKIFKANGYGCTTSGSFSRSEIN